MQNMLDYFNQKPLLSDRKISKLLSDRIKHLVRSHQWNLQELLDISESSISEVTLALAFNLSYKGQKMPAVLLIRGGCPYTFYNDSIIFLFADEYVYASKPVDVRTLWSMDMIWDTSVYKHLVSYAADHPRIGLEPYLDRYIEADNFYNDYTPLQRNFLIPMLAGYHKGLELLTKAGLYHLAKYMFICEQRPEQPEKTALLKVSPDSYDNLSDWLGVSHKVLVKLDRMVKEYTLQKPSFPFAWWDVLEWYPAHRIPLTNMEFFARLSDIQRYNPAYLNLEKYTPQMLRFMMENHLIHHRPAGCIYRIRRRIPGVSKMKDIQILTILRYLTILPQTLAGTYFAYLEYCGHCIPSVKEYPGGLQPKNLSAAYDEAEALYNNPYTFAKYRNRFSEQVSKPGYRFWETGKDDLEIGTDYCVRIPEAPASLVTESNHLGHCVKDYCKDVALGHTYILFLRRTGCPDRPFVTMEVTKSRKLIQAKASQNTHAPVDAQYYIRRWARKKGLIIDTYDLSETA